MSLSSGPPTALNRRDASGQWIRKRITRGGWRPGFAAANVVKLLIAMADSAIGPTDYLFAMPNRYGVIVIGNPQHATGLSRCESMLDTQPGHISATELALSCEEC
ncbi:hypothetical protein CN090_34670 [Sinorhizobium meliloti]|nr:hypothetical protein CN090_34670 [Sinorhizobium meliloti]